MPVYWFQVDVPEAPPIAAQRVQALVGPAPRLSVKELFLGRRKRTDDPVFVGSVRSLSFSIYRYITGRNSWLPVIRGRLTSIGTGTRVTVIMFVHPGTAVFTAFWLAFTGRYALIDYGAALMFLFMVALTVGSFFPEAIKAKRLLVAALNPSSQPYVSTTPIS